jgi:heme exporter protein B
VSVVAWRQFAAILRKDLVRELRTRQMLVSMFLFVMLALVIFHYAFSGHVYAGRDADLTFFTGGMLWTVFIFAALLGFNRSFAQEKDEDCLDGLLSCPVDRLTIFLAKMSGNLIFLLIIQAVAVPFFSLLFIKHSFASHLPVFIVVTLLADLGLCVLGTLLAAMSVNTRARDLLLPIIFMPLTVPVLIAATAATTGIFARGDGFAQLGGKLLFLVAFDAVFMVAAYGTCEFVIGE